MPLPPPRKKRKHHTTFSEKHPYVIKLDIKLSKLNQQLASILEVADCDLILTDAKTGLNDFSVNEKLAKKLDDAAKKLLTLSQKMADRATTIRQKIYQAIDTKANLQDIQCIGEVLEYSKQCDKLKLRDKRPTRFKASSEFQIKREILDSSDEGSNAEVEGASKKAKSTEFVAGEPDGHFQYKKQNENDPEAHHFTCDICQSVFHDTNDLHNHLCTHSMEFYRCMVCFKVFRSIRSFENHRKSHMTSYTCEICNKVFQLKPSLTNHLQMHSADRMKCSHPGCTKPFQFRQNHLEHVQWAHRKTKDVPCQHCPKMFQTPTSMRTHRVSKHGKVCDITPGHPNGKPRPPSEPNGNAKPASKNISHVAGSSDTSDFNEVEIGTLRII